MNKQLFLNLLAQSIYAQSMKDAGIYLGRKKKKQRDFFGLRKKD